MTGTLHENVCVLMIISRRILVIMRNVRKKKAVEKIKTHILYIVTIFPENRGVYVIVCENIVEPDRPQLTIWCMRISY